MRREEEARKRLELLKQQQKSQQGPAQVDTMSLLDDLLNQVAGPLNTSNPQLQQSKIAQAVLLIFFRLLFSSSDVFLRSSPRSKDGAKRKKPSGRPLRKNRSKLKRYLVSFYLSKFRVQTESSFSI